MRMIEGRKKGRNERVKRKEEECQKGKGHGGNKSRDGSG